MGTLGIKDIMAKYGLGRDKVLELLHREGCPLIERKKGQTYLVHEEAFDKWLKGQVYRRKRL